MARKAPKYKVDGQAPETRNIDEIMGNTRAKSGAFGTMNAELYAEQLSGKSLIDLQRECVEHGIWPGGHDSDTLKSRLIEAHARYAAKYVVSTRKAVPQPKISKAAQAVLDKGKNQIK